jgi:hypothetical protein
MTNRRVTLATGLILPMVQAGCVPGYNSLLFTTKTNVGFVVDTKPPEVNLDIGRQELLFAPTYEEGKTPPVMASFRFNSEKVFNNYLGSAFATGDASVAMSRLYDSEDWPDAKGDKAWGLTAKDWKDEEDDYDSSVALANKPKYPWFVPPEEPGKVRPVLFGTDTSFGFKASWAGMESALPDYVRLAYQRRELAFAAVTIGPDEDDVGNITGLKARTPSLLATVDAKMEVGKFLDTDLEYLQYFASGRAATALAMRKAVRDAMLRRLDPEQRQVFTEGVTFNAGPEAEAPRARILSWIDDDTPVNVSALREAAETLTSKAQQAALVAGQSVQDAKNAQRDAEEVQSGAEVSRAEAKRLCQESELADVEGKRTALEDARAELARAQEVEQATKEAMADPPTSEETTAHDEAVSNVASAQTNVQAAEQAFDGAIAKQDACNEAVGEAERLEQNADDAAILADFKHRFADKAMNASTTARLAAEKVKIRADAAVLAARGLDDAQEGFINRQLLSDWLWARGYRIHHLEWLYSVSAVELQIAIRELEIP